MLFVAVNEPHTEEAIAYTHSVDPEIDHEDTQYKPGHRQELLTLEKAMRRCLIHQRVVVKYRKISSSWLLH